MEAEPPPADAENPNLDTIMGEDTIEKKKCFCLKFFDYGGVWEARGFSNLGIARGALIMSNIVFATALIDLATLEAGCDLEDDEDCENKVYGFTPTSLISNIAVLSGLLSAFFMPIIGAIVDYTPQRRLVGILAAVLMIMIQTLQIGVSDKTWFIMAIFQAIAAFLYQVEILSTYAYLPDISRKVGQDKMTIYSSKFTMIQFLAQLLFLLLVGVLSTGLSLKDNVVTAQVSQGVNVLWVSVFFGWGWKCMPTAPARHELEEGHSLWLEGFRQNWKTISKINKEYKNGLRWFLLATTFAEASAAAITSVSVVYLTESIGFSADQIIVFFMVTLLSSAPGTKFASYVTNWTNPNLSWQLSMVSLFLVLLIGSLTLTKDAEIFTYIWGVVIGFMLGWFYPTENLFFSMCLPKGLEAELSGFFVYCTQILGWLPPLLFTILVEQGVSQNLGVVVAASILLIAAAVLRCAAPWDEIVAEANQHKQREDDESTP